MEHKTLEQRLEEFYGKPIEEVLAEAQAERAAGHVGRTAGEVLADMDRAAGYWMDCTPPAEYFEPVDPYAGPQFSAAFDLQALTDYAREKGLPIAELTREEVEQFKIKKLNKEGGAHMAKIEIDRDTMEQFKAICEKQGRDAEFAAVLLIRWATEHPEELDYILS